MTANSVLNSLLLLLVMTPFAVSAQAVAPCGSDPFVLRAAVEHGTASSLCRAVYESDLDSKSGVKQLQATLRSQPGIDEAYQANLSLFQLYMREGRYRRAESQLDKILAVKPHDPDALSVVSMVRALSRFPDLSVSRSKATNLQGEWADGLLHIPIRINGSPGTYIMDTGASISAMSQSEAKRLGLSAISSSSKLTDGSRLESSAVQVTNVADLQVGGTHLHNAGFVILPDTVSPFDRLPENNRGILGIPLLIALHSFHISPDATVTLSPSARADKRRVIKFAFSELIPATEVDFGDATLTFAFDTGAFDTTLHPRFAKRYPQIVQKGSAQPYSSTGVGGTRKIDSSVVSDLSLVFGRPVVLHMATVLLSDQQIANDWADGNLGFDLVQQVLPITVDFEHMSLSF